MNMKPEMRCTECGNSSLKVIYGRPICIRCGTELESYNTKVEGGGWDRKRTIRNLNRIRRFGFILNQLSYWLGLTEEQITEVKRFITDLVKLIGTSFRPSGHLLVAYSIWRVLRSEGVPVSLNEILNMTNRLFNKNYKVRHVNRLINRISHINRNIDLYIHVRVEDYIDYVIDRIFLERPDMKYNEVNEIREMAKNIYKIINRECPISNPKVAAGVSISISITLSKSINQSWSIDRMVIYISELLGLSYYTLKRRVREATRKVGLIKKSFTIYI